MTKRRYWINTTDFTKRVGLGLTSMEPVTEFILTFDLVECSWLVYHMFMNLKINLIAGKGKTFKWFTWERDIKEWKEFITRILKGY